MLINFYCGLSIINTIVFIVYLLDYNIRHKGEEGKRKYSAIEAIIDLLKVCILIFVPVLDIFGFLVLIYLLFSEK